MKRILKWSILISTFVVFLLVTQTEKIYADEKKEISDVVYIEEDYYIYDGKPKDFSAKVVEVSDKDRNVLRRDIDYQITSEDNINVGQGKLIITGIGDYTGVITLKVKIKPSPINWSKIEEIPEQDYTGNEIRPELNITSLDNSLVKDVDYTVAFSDNVDCGIAQAEITGIGNYDGTVYKSFRIVNHNEKKNISKISAYNIPQIYTGKPIELNTFRVEDIYGDALVQDVDYVIEYTDNINIGVATVTVIGIGEYTGTVTCQFQILPISLGSLNVQKIPDKKYTGKEICPTVKVAEGKIILTEGKDYKIEYIDNVDVGTAKVKITGMGNYSGIVTCTFKIEKADQTIKAENFTKTYGDKSFKLNAKVTGDAKLKYTSSNKKVVTITSDGKIEIKGAGKAQIKIVAPETAGCKRAEKRITVKVLPKAPQFTLSKEGKNKIKVKWTKGSGIGQNFSSCRYYINYSSKKDFSGSKTVVVNGKNISKVITGLESGKKYYVKISTYSSELKAYSVWTKSKTIKV